MPGSLIVAGGTVLTPRGWTEADVVVEGGKITRLGRGGRGRGQVLDAEGARVLPGLIDLQVNGAFGKTFSAAGLEEIVEVARGLARLGTTGFLATLVSLPAARLLEALGRLREAAGDDAGAGILGAHLEGPFLNPQRAGAHREESIRPPNLVEFSKLATAGDGVVRMMTVAPEVKGAVSLIAAGVKRGMVMAVGHTSAGAADLEEAVRAGATVVTHLFNAMAPFHHRHENAVAAALIDDRLTCTCIYDRHHINRAAMMIARRCKPPGRLMLVSDATAALEAPEGAFQVEGRRYVVKGGQVTVHGTQTLGGSAVSLLQGVRQLAEDLGLPLEEAWRMASAVPAGVLGLDRIKGEIAVGYDADMVVLEKDWSLRATVVRGTIAYGHHHSG
ncbi:MAG: N-acetylglucosamine-6-phosphate deacetylase [Planctomycetes bacterium]|nr:N-acetylglucosamine-6-phosphate deacetylase [Planctomycetota bacterium]